MNIIEGADRNIGDREDGKVERKVERKKLDRKSLF
jgi:hypothetical protein